MFEVTEKAGEVIRKLLEGKDPQSVRIMMMEGGCSGPSLGMALDGPLDSDEVFTEQGVQFVIDKGLLEEAKPISIDFVETAMGAGFMLRSALAAKQGDSCCASSAGGCGSGCGTGGGGCGS